MNKEEHYKAQVRRADLRDLSGFDMYWEVFYRVMYGDTVTVTVEPNGLWCREVSVNSITARVMGYPPVRDNDLEDIVYLSLYTSSGHPMQCTVVRKHFLEWLNNHHFYHNHTRQRTIRELTDKIESAGVEVDVFMYLFEHSTKLAEEMEADQCEAVFTSILKGSDDLSYELFADVCAEYGQDIKEVFAKSGVIIAEVDEMAMEGREKE